MNSLARVLVISLVSTLATTPAQAAPTKAQTLATQAKRAYDDAQYDRAAELYLAASQADADGAQYLYAAARAAHMGGRLDRADELYRKALASAKLPPELTAKVQTYLDAVAGARADKLDAEAAAQQSANNFAAAADTWRSAAALQPKRAAYWCRAGRAARLGGDKAAAQRDYMRCQDTAAEGSPERADAERVVAELATASPDKPDAVAVKSPEPADRTTAWAAAAGAVVGVAGGAALLWLGKGASAEANALPVRNQAEVTAYNTAFDRAERLWWGGAAAAGVGVVAGVASLYLHNKAAAKATLAAVPLADGAMVVVLW